MGGRDLNLVNVYNKENKYHIDFRRELEKKDFGEEIHSLDLRFTDIAKTPSSTSEILARAVNNFIGNPEDVKYIIIDSSLILDGTSENIIRIKKAIKEFASRFEHFFLIKSGDENCDDLKKNSHGGKNYYLFTESNKEILIEKILHKILEIESGNNLEQVFAEAEIFTEPKKEAKKKSLMNRFLGNKSEEKEDKENNKKDVDEVIDKKKDIEPLEHEKKKKEKEPELKKEKKQEIKESTEGLEKVAKNISEIKIVKQAERNRKEDLGAGIIKHNDISISEMKAIQRKTNKVNPFEEMKNVVSIKKAFETRRSWSTDNIIIVKGLSDNIGATYLSFLISNILNRNNAYVLCIRDSSDDFNHSLENYKFEKEELFFNHNGIRYTDDFFKVDGVHFYVIDTKESYYQNREVLIENGLKPLFFIVSNADAKGFPLIKNEFSLIKGYEIPQNEFIFFFRNINQKFIEKIEKELEIPRENIIKYQYIEHDVFSELSAKNALSDKLLKILEERSSNLELKKENQFIFSEDEEIEI